MLHDIIVHHLVIEGNRIFGRHVVGQLLFRLNNVCFAGLCSVAKPIIYGVPDTHKHFFMLKSSIFLSDQPWRGWAVSLHRDRVIKFSHHLVEFISVDLGLWVRSISARIKHLRLWDLSAPRFHQSCKLFVQSLCCLLKLLITEFIRRASVSWSLLRLDRLGGIGLHFWWGTLGLSSLRWRINGISFLFGLCSVLNPWTWRA
jgi:hypothetical protein